MFCFSGCREGKIEKMPVTIFELQCHKGVGPNVEGRALVTEDDFSARYDLNRIKGIFSRPQHGLAGQSYVGRILVFNNVKGGVASAWMLHEMKNRNLAPAAILFNRANPIIVQGAQLANITLCDRFQSGDITQLVKTGDVVKVFPLEGVVTVEREF